MNLKKSVLHIYAAVASRLRGLCLRIAAALFALLFLFTSCPVAMAESSGLPLSPPPLSSGKAGDTDNKKQLPPPEAQEAAEEQEQAPAVEAAEVVEKPFDYLSLVNWKNTYTGEGYDLVRLDTVIDKGLVQKKNHHLISRQAGLAANEMFRAAKAEGISTFVVDNSYRSVGRQAAMFNKRKKRDESYGADPYSNPVKVLPGGISEHATGLAMDIFAKSYQKSNIGYANTAEGKWLCANAHRFGFILRYPANKEHITGVIFEPWHYRYVGASHASEIYRLGLCLEEYHEMLTTQSLPLAKFPA